MFRTIGFQWISREFDLASNFGWTYLRAQMELEGVLGANQLSFIRTERCAQLQGPRTHQKKENPKKIFFCTNFRNPVTNFLQAHSSPLQLGDRASKK